MLKNLIRPPFCYIGAKTKLLEWIYSFFPEHTTFVDVFGGTGVVTFNKIPSKNDVYNDINSRIVNFYAVLRDEYKRNQLQDLIALTPYAREEFNRCKEPCQDDEIEDARRFYVRQNQSFSGNGGDFGFIKGYENSVFKNFRKMWKNNLINRLNHILFENTPFERILKNYDSKEALFYCDPPYINTADYKNQGVEYTEEDHKRLIECLLNIKGMVIMSNYENELNKPLLNAGWRLEKKKNCCRFTNNINKKIKTGLNAYTFLLAL